MLKLEYMVINTWYPQNQINIVDYLYPIRQIYVYVITEDEKILLVSKDNSKWQIPGGKPNKGENLLEAAQREVYEETGLEIDQKYLASNLKFEGYYKVEKENSLFLQLRLSLKYNKKSSEIKLEPIEDMTQVEEDIIKYAKFISQDDIKNKIKWFQESYISKGEALTIEKLFKKNQIKSDK